MLDESRIIRRCQHGQVREMDLLIDRYQVPLYSLCRKLTRNVGDADDLFQDTWAAALRGIRSFACERPFRPWLFAICINRYRDAYRRSRRRNRWLRLFRSSREESEAAAHVRGPEPGPEQERHQEDRLRALHEAIASLDDGHRLPVLLHYDRGLGLSEVAEILDVPEGTIKSRLSAARERIRLRMEARDHG